MSIRLRRALFWLFAIFFFVAAPLIVLYTAGYRYAFTSGRIQRTGVIAVSTSPRGATIAINGKQAEETSPYVIQRLMPGDYTVELSRRGYQNWTQEVTVESGRTTYITSTLFAESSPELLLEETAAATSISEDGRTLALLLADDLGMAEVWLYDIATRTERLLGSSGRPLESGDAIVWSADQSVVILTANGLPIFGWTTEGIAITTDSIAAEFNQLPEYVFIDNGANVELRKYADPASSNLELVALLPYSVYSVIYRDADRAIFTDERNRIYVLSFAGDSVSEIVIPAPLLDKHEESGLFLASDGYEIVIADLSTNEREFITRQSDPVVDIAWHPRGDALFVATTHSIVALDREAYTARVTTTLANGESIMTMWPDQTGRNLYFFGSVEGISGLYRVRLVR